MTIEELNAFFKTLDPQINRVGESSLIQFENIDRLGEYLKHEADFWGQYNNGEVSNIHNRYRQLYHAFTDIANQIATGQSDAARLNLKAIVDELRSAPIQLLQSDSSLGKYIASEYTQSYEVASGIYSYFAKRIDRNMLGNFQMFLGVLKGHWYQHAAHLLAGAQKEQVGTLEREARSYNEIFRDIMANAAEQLRQNDRRLSEQVDNFGQKTGEMLDAFNLRFKEQGDQFVLLNQTYEEHLRLKGPARYWIELSRSYESKGGVWRNWAIGISAVFVALIGLVLYNPPPLYDMTQEFWNSKNIKGTILSAIVVSTFVYVIQFTIKLALSSFHLARDAKERAQLTYFYLAMLKKGALQDSERGVVMQSLFSRSDSGLLKNDAGPTMPTAVLDTFKPNKPTGN